MHVHTLEDALGVYYDALGAGADIPAGDSGYDWELGGWLLENINGVLALVCDDASIVWPVCNAEGYWILPDE